MSKYEKEILKDIKKRLKTSNPRKWRTLTESQRESLPKTYYQIRDTDYKNINFLLREHADERKQFYFLILGVCIGIFAAPISSILLKYLPAETGWDDLRTVSLFAFLLLGLVLLFTRASAESLGDENVIERLLEIMEQGDIESNREA